jgi:hypothetical protein
MRPEGQRQREPEPAVGRCDNAASNNGVCGSQHQNAADGCLLLLLLRTTTCAAAVKARAAAGHIG